MFDLIQNYINWRKYRDLVINNEIIQTSEKGENQGLSFTESGIRVRNNIMRKPITKFTHFHPNYFNRWVSKKKVIIPMIYKLFGDYVRKGKFFTNRKSDFTIFDKKSKIEFYEIIKDLALIEFDNKHILIYFGKYDNIDQHNIGSFILSDNNTRNFTPFNPDILKRIQQEELRVYFSQNSDLTNPQLILEKFTILFFKKKKSIEAISSEKEDYIKLFETNNVDKLNVYDYTKYLYFNSNDKIRWKDILNIGYTGAVGTGKTYLLLNVLAQILLSDNFKRFIYLDTQDSFEKELLPMLNPIYKARIQKHKDYYFKITENNLVLSETDYANCVSFLLEQLGYSKKDKKSKLLGEIDYTGDKEEFLEKLDFKIRQMENDKTLFKTLKEIEDLKKLYEFAKKTNIGATTIFDDIEVNNRHITILNFENIYFYEACSYIYLRKFDDILYSKEDMPTYLSCDELQKYSRSDMIKSLILQLVKEKRQFGFRFNYTALEYSDVNFLFKFTKHLFNSSISDLFIRNQLAEMTDDEDLKKAPKDKAEKIIMDNYSRKIYRYSLKNPIFKS